MLRQLCSRVNPMLFSVLKRKLLRQQKKNPTKKNKLRTNIILAALAAAIFGKTQGMGLMDTKVCDMLAGVFKEDCSCKCCARKGCKGCKTSKKSDGRCGCKCCESRGCNSGRCAAPASPCVYRALGRKAFDHCKGKAVTVVSGCGLGPLADMIACI